MSKLLEEFIKENVSENTVEEESSIDGLIISLFDCVDEFIDLIKSVVTKGGLLNESKAGDIIVRKAGRINGEITRIFNRIDDMINPPQGTVRQTPDLEETNELIDILNEDQIPQILKWMDRVFRNYKRKGVKPYDDDDKKNMYDVCLAFKEFVDSLRVLISRLGQDYILPREFELTHHYPWV